MIEKPWLKHYEPGLPHTLQPYPQCTLLDVMRDTVQQRPDHTALIFKGTRVSYARLEQLTNLRIVIIANDPLARAGLAALLAAEPGCQVIGQTPADGELAATLEVYRPDAALWDLGWDPQRVATPGDKSALERLLELEQPELPLVALLPDVAHAATLWAVGVRGLLFRDAAPEALVTALTAAAARLAVLDPALARTLIAPAERPTAALLEALTPRELEVLHHLAEGLSNKEIARKLIISEHTVKFHINAILGKLGAQSRTEAVVRATRLGLVAL